MLDTIPNGHPDIPTLVRLTTPYSSACPASGEPQTGSTIAVIYRPMRRLIELHAVQAYLRRFSEGDEPIDLETVAQCTARDVAAVLGVPVVVSAHYLLRGGLEMRCICQS